MVVLATATMVMGCILSARAGLIWDNGEIKSAPLTEFVNSAFEKSPIINNNLDVAAAKAQDRGFVYVKHGKEVGIHSSKHVIVYKVGESKKESTRVRGFSVFVAKREDALNPQSITSSITTDSVALDSDSKEVPNVLYGRNALHTSATDKVICLYINEYRTPGSSDDPSFTLWNLEVLYGPAAHSIQELLNHMAREEDVSAFDKVLYDEISIAAEIPNPVQIFEKTALDKLKAEYKCLAKKVWSPVIYGKEERSGRNVVVFQIDGKSKSNSDTAQYVAVVFKGTVKAKILKTSKSPIVEMAQDKVEMQTEKLLTNWNLLVVVANGIDDYGGEIQNQVKLAEGLTVNIVQIWKNNLDVFSNYVFTVCKHDEGYCTVVTQVSQDKVANFSLLLRHHATVIGALAYIEFYPEYNMPWKHIESSTSSKYAGPRKELVDKALGRMLSDPKLQVEVDFGSSNADILLEKSKPTKPFHVLTTKSFANGWKLQLLHESEFTKRFGKTVKKVYVFVFKFKKSGYTTLYAAAMNRSKQTLKKNSKDKLKDSSSLRVSIKEIDVDIMRSSFEESPTRNSSTVITSKKGIPRVAVTPFFDNLQNLLQMSKKDFETFYIQRTENLDTVLGARHNLNQDTIARLHADILQDMSTFRSNVTGPFKINPLFRIDPPREKHANASNVHVICEVQHGMDFESTLYFAMDPFTHSKYNVLLPVIYRSTTYEALNDVKTKQNKSLIWKNTDSESAKSIKGQYPHLEEIVTSKIKVLLRVLRDAEEWMLEILKPYKTTHKLLGKNEAVGETFYGNDVEFLANISQNATLICTTAFMRRDKVNDVFVYEFCLQGIAKYAMIIAERNTSDSTKVAIILPLVFNIRKIVNMQIVKLDNLVGTGDLNESTTVWTCDRLTPPWAGKFFIQERKNCRKALKPLDVSDSSETELEIVLNGMQGSRRRDEPETLFLVYQITSSTTPEYFLLTLNQHIKGQHSFDINVTTILFTSLEDVMDSGATNYDLNKYLKIEL